MGKTLLSTIYFILGITITTEITYLSLVDSIAPANIKQSIKENLLTGLMYDENGNKTEIFNTILRITELDEQTVIKLMKNETADQIITDGVNSIYDYNLTGDESYKYTREKIINIVEENMDKVLREIGYNITEKERKEIINYTHNNADYIIDTIYKTDIGDYKR